MDFSTILTVAVSLITLSFLEIILGIDNLIFIAIAASHVKPEQQWKARTFGLLFAMVTRLLLLASIFQIAQLRTPILVFSNMQFSGRDLILLAGGIFLLYKATRELHSEVMEINPEEEVKMFHSLLGTIIQIGFLDIVFSIDSVITAVGMTDIYWIMAIAVIIGIFVMIFVSGILSKFIDENPTLKVLAVSFILMVGMILVADGFGTHIPRQYLYFAICFSIFVEIINIKVRNNRRGKKHAH